MRDQPLAREKRHSATVTKKQRPAPDPELVQMYWQGIPSPKIAAITGIAEGTVRYHLGVAFEADPGLRDAHKTARGPSPAHLPGCGT